MMTISKVIFSRFVVTLFVTCGATALSSPAIAQIIPDSTLLQSSIVTPQVTPQNNQSTITGGTRVGNNLFHSFQLFSVLTGTSAVFNHDLSIENIVTRVTGKQASTIDGLVQVNGTANLFLLNPNGIVFGKNTTLNITGSFFATTAPGLRFSDGTVFSVDPTQPTLLTINTPLGVQWGTGATGAITNAGMLNVGQTLTIAAENISSPGSLTATGIVLQAKQDIITGLLSSGSGGVLIESEAGKLNVGPITASALNSGDITLKASGDITTSSISTLGILPSDAFDFFPDIPDSTAGRISIQSVNGAIDTQAGALTTHAMFQSGGIVLQAAKDIRIGDLTAMTPGLLPGVLTSPMGTPILNGGITITTPNTLSAIGTAEQPVQILVNTLPGRSGGYIGTGPIEMRAKVIDFDRVNINNQSQSDTTFIANQLSFTRSQVDVGSSPTESDVLTLPTLNFQIANELQLNETKLGTNLSNTLFANVNIEAGQFTANNSEIILASIYEDPNFSLRTRSDNLLLRTRDAIVLNNSKIVSTVFGYSVDDFISSGGLFGGNALLPTKGGTVTLQGASIQLLNGSTITSAVPPGRIGDAGRIRVMATGDLYLSNSTIGALVGDAGIGTAGQIELKSDRFILDNASSVNATSYNIFEDYFASAESGIEINARTIEINGGSQISTTARGTQAPTELLTVSERGGNIRIQAGDLQITGQGSSLRAGTESDLSTGVGGNITIQTNTLTLRSGGTISTSTIGNGNAGNLQVTARDRITMIGTGHPTGLLASSSAAGRSGDITVTALTIGISRAQVSVNSSATGDGGKLNIQASDALRVSEGELSALTFSGKGAEIKVETPLLSLDRSAIIAATIQGEGGNISLLIQNLLLLRQSSQISATANNNSNGGNIDIMVPNGFIVAIPNENSDITANANRGRGGNINIIAQSVFGIVPRSQSTPLSDITASSDLGIDGTIRLTSLEPEPNPNPQEIPQLVDNSDHIAQTCSPKARSNSFVITGKGGLPPNPSDSLNATQPWRSTSSATTSVATLTATSTATPILEATHWVKDPDGSISLAIDASVRSSLQASASTCTTGVR